MQVQLTGFGCQANGVIWTVQTHAELEDDVPVANEIIVNLSGELLGSGQRDIANKCANFQRAIQQRWPDVVLRGDDGSVLEALRSSATISGVHLVSGPNYTDGTGADFATKRSFSCTFRAIALANPGQRIFRWSQILETGGGGPRSVFQEATSGDPMKVTTVERTPYTATQSGSAVGLLGFPPIPGPIFSPRHLVDNPKITRVSPTRVGRGVLRWPISWSYQFMANGPLSGLPGLPP